jgi:crossover junction endodeoxyribonuclease RusA
MIRYEFPWPPRELSPNVSVHWRTLGKAKAQYKEDCEWFLLVAAPTSKGYYSPLEPPVTAQVTFVCDARRRDPDNHMAMLKPLWDALVEMGVLEDDSHDKLKIAEPRWERGPEKKVIVELSPNRNGGE